MTMTAIACLQALVLLPAWCLGQSLENDRFRVDLKGSNGVTVTEKGGESVEFTLDFVVLHNPADPELALRPTSEVKYTIPSWKAADPAQANLLQSQVGHDMVGDGFDASILEGGTEGRTSDIFQAAPAFWISPVSHTVMPGGVRYLFGKHGLFSFSALVELEPGQAYPKLSFHLEPSKDGYYSVGYVGAPACSIIEADEIWQPLIWQEKRFPRHSHLTLAFRCPVPSAFVTQEGVTTGVVADPGEYPFDPLPLSSNSRFGVAVRDVNGKARAMLFAPALGGLGSKMEAGTPYHFAMHLFLTGGDPTDAQEKVAREIYGFRDDRNNALGSLNRTIDNLRDYIMSDYSLFREDQKGCNYSTDAPGTVKNVSSIDPLDLSIVLDDEAMFEHRARPYMEYMLSRGKFLFSTDETQKIQSPSYRLDGPAAPVSELASLYAMFHRATPLFKTLAEEELMRSRIRNLDVPDKGDTWWNALSLFITTRDERHLQKAIQGADRYLAERVNTPQIGFEDPDAPGGAFFWTGFVPRYIDLLMLFEASGEERFLEAAHAAARRYAQFVWMSPAIPDTTVTVNEGGQAPEYWYLRGKGHKRVLLPEESVPAWRLSAIGLTPESSGTSAGHRAIFMANHAPWMLKIGYLTGDDYLMAIARSAVIGRYRNFPGYHINTARTTAYEKEDFPLVGHKDQSVSSFHYNHPLPMLSMLVDYLVTDAHVRSGGQIDFPYNYSEGYAYMQNKAYGSMQGTFFGRDDALLWMPKGLLQVPDQINFITARGTNDFYLALMNESQGDLIAEVILRDDLFPGMAQRSYEVEIVADGNQTSTTLVGGRMRVPVKARGLTALVVKGLKVIPAFQNKIADLDATAAWDLDLLDLRGAAGRAMVLNLGSEKCYAYVYLEYRKHDYTKVEMVYRSGHGEKRLQKKLFPWEFTVPLGAEVESFTCTLFGHQADGTVVAITSPATLKRKANPAEIKAARTTGNDDGPRK